MEFPQSDNVEFVINGDASGGTIIHVLDNMASFNVTGAITFNNIEFRGESALAAPTNPSATSFAHPPLAVLPAKKCTVQTAPDGSHTAL